MWKKSLLTALLLVIPIVMQAQRVDIVRGADSGYFLIVQQDGLTDYTGAVWSAGDTLSVDGQIRFTAEYTALRAGLSWIAQNDWPNHAVDVVGGNRYRLGIDLWYVDDVVIADTVYLPADTVYADTLYIPSDSVRVDTVYFHSEGPADRLPSELLRSVDWQHKMNPDSTDERYLIEADSWGESTTFSYRCGDDLLRTHTVQGYFSDLVSDSVSTGCDHLTFSVTATGGQYLHEYVETISLPKFYAMGLQFDITSNATLHTHDNDNLAFALSEVRNDLTAEEANAFWDAVSADGGNLRVYHGENQVARQVVAFDKASENGWIFFDSSGATANQANTWTIVVEENATEPAPDSQFGSEAVWNDYIAVLHLIEDGDGTDDEFTDSSGNGNHGKADTHGTQLPSRITTGPMGLPAQNFSGEAFIRVPNSVSLNENYAAISISTFVRDATGSDFDGRVVSKPLGATGDSWHLGTQPAGGGGNPRARVSAGGSTVTASSNNNELTASGWLQFSSTYNGNQIEGFVAGASFDQASQSGTIDTDGQDMTIGAHLDSDSRRNYSGDISSIRIRGFAVNGEYFVTENNNYNQHSSFWTVENFQEAGLEAGYSGATLRSVTHASAASPATNRNIISLADQSTATERKVTSLAGHSGVTVRSVTHTSAASAATNRSVSDVAAASPTTSRKVNSLADQPAATERKVTSLAGHSGATSRALTSLAAFAGDTVRTVKKAASYSAATLRQVIEEASASYSAATHRNVISGADSGGSTQRTVTSAAEQSAATERKVTAAASASSATLRIVNKLATFAGSTVRTVRTAASYSGATLRQIIEEASASYSGATRRSVTKADQVSGSTLRKVTDGAEQSAATHRKVTAAAVSSTATIRIVKSVAAFAGACGRAVTSEASALGATARKVLKTASYGGATSRAVKKITSYSAATLRTVRETVFVEAPAVTRTYMKIVRVKTRAAINQVSTSSIIKKIKTRIRNE